MQDRQEEDNEDRKSRRSVLWRVWGRSLPRSEVVFICQMLIIYIVIAVSLFNLTRGHPSESLWITLLSASLGYALPSPTLDTSHKHVLHDTAQ